ncbi:hypothetical protein DFH09DRAFT_1113654 [Mycena vulgaris]|nr:hypothetical protein DFH09DRAFT_1113654 [Mycena vulgaris]
MPAAKDLVPLPSIHQAKCKFPALGTEGPGPWVEISGIFYALEDSQVLLELLDHRNRHRLQPGLSKHDTHGGDVSGSLEEKSQWGSQREVLHAATCGDLRLRPATYVYTETCGELDLRPATVRLHAVDTVHLPVGYPSATILQKFFTENCTSLNFMTQICPHLANNPFWIPKLTQVRVHVSTSAYVQLRRSTGVYVGVGRHRVPSTLRLRG